MSDNAKTGFHVTMNLVAIIAIFLVAGVGNYMNPAIATMAAAWPESTATAINNVSTLPALVSLPVMLIVSAVAGKKIKYKPLMIFALIVSLIGGLGPYFYAPSWTVVLVFRAILGVGAGCFGVRSAIMLSSVPKEYQATCIGIGTGLYSGVNLVLGPVVGALAEISWNTPFLVNALCLITLILVLFFLKEPEVQQDAEAAQENAAGGTKAPISGKAVFYAILQAIATGSMYPLLLGLSTFYASHGLGDAVMAGTATTCYSLGCLITLVLGPIQKVFKNYTAFVGYLLATAGLALVYFVPGVATSMAGALIGGAGFMIAFSMIQVFTGMVVTPAQLAFSTTLILVGNQLGVYISSYIINIFDGIFHLATPYESAFLGGVIVFAVFTVASLVKGIIVPKTA